MLLQLAQHTLPRPAHTLSQFAQLLEVNCQHPDLLNYTKLTYNKLHLHVAFAELLLLLESSPYYYCS